MTIVNVLWSSRLPTEPGYYWISRGIPGDNIFFTQFDGFLFRTINSDPISLTESIRAFGVGQWFSGPIYPPGPTSTGHDDVVKDKVSELHQAKENFNTLVQELTINYDLEVQIEFLEAKTDSGPLRLDGIEVFVKKEIYPY